MTDLRLTDAQWDRLIDTMADGIASGVGPHLGAALRKRGVHLVTVESLAGAAQNHETSGIHGSLHCSLACGASLFAALDEEA